MAAYSYFQHSSRLAAYRHATEARTCMASAPTDPRVIFFLIKLCFSVSSGASGKHLGIATFAYLITGDRCVELCVYMNVEVRSRRDDTADEAVPTIPRVGISLDLPRALQRVQWCGLGPHENYPDRRSSAYLGQFKQHLGDMHTPCAHTRSRIRSASMAIPFAANKLSRIEQICCAF